MVERFLKDKPEAHFAFSHVQIPPLPKPRSSRKYPNLSIVLCD